MPWSGGIQSIKLLAANRRNGQLQHNLAKLKTLRFNRELIYQIVQRSESVSRGPSESRNLSLRFRRVNCNLHFTAKFFCRRVACLSTVERVRFSVRQRWSRMYRRSRTVTRR